MWVGKPMKFNVLAWSALCFFYRSVADRNYVRVMADTQFLSALRDTPSNVSLKDFEDKVILNNIRIENYDLLLKHNLAAQVLTAIIDLQPELSAMRGASILDCDLSDGTIASRINNVYRSLCSIPGLWSTGASKILHTLNDKLFAVLDPRSAVHFRLQPREGELVPFLRVVQGEALEVVENFHQHGFPGSPEDFLSERLGYAQQGCHKSLLKFIDEYYWLRFGDGLPVPPPWLPEVEPLKSKSPAESSS